MAPKTKMTRRTDEENEKKGKKGKKTTLEKSDELMARDSSSGRDDAGELSEHSDEGLGAGMAITPGPMEGPALNNKLHPTTGGKSEFSFHSFHQSFQTGRS
jgi:hypothetical protein